MIEEKSRWSMKNREYKKVYFIIGSIIVAILIVILIMLLRKIADAIYIIGILVGIVISAFVLKRKAYTFFLSFIVICCLAIARYSWDNIYQFIMVTANNNVNKATIDTVWYDEENYAYNDILIYTIIKDKYCITNEKCWYLKYADTFSKGTILDLSLNTNELNTNDFIELVSVSLWANYTLMPEQVVVMLNEGNAPRLFIKTDDLENTNEVVLINDEEGNIYIYAYGENKK